MYILSRDECELTSGGEPNGALGPGYGNAMLMGVGSIALALIYMTENTTGALGTTGFVSFTPGVSGAALGAGEWIPCVSAAVAGLMVGYAISQLPPVQAAIDAIGYSVGTYLGNHRVVF